MGLLPGAPTRICQRSVVILLKTDQVAHVGVNAALSPGKPAAGSYSPASPTESCEHRPGAGSVRGRLAGPAGGAPGHVVLAPCPSHTETWQDVCPPGKRCPSFLLRDNETRTTARPLSGLTRRKLGFHASCCFRPISSHSSLLSSLWLSVRFRSHRFCVFTLGCQEPFLGVKTSQETT